MKVTGWPSMILSCDLQDIRVLSCKCLPLLHTVVLVHCREQIMLGREERGGEEAAIHHSNENWKQLATGVGC